MTRSRTLVAGVLMAIVVGAGCGDDEPATDGDAAGPQAGVVRVSIDGNAFDPRDLTISVGDEVEWINDDTATHTVTADDGRTFASEQLSTGDSFRQRFDTAGEFSYTCEIHPFMQGTVLVA